MELIFVYNADSGRWNAYMDMLHKVFSPKTYPCSLCAITYGVFSIDKKWEAFLAEYPIPTRFLHRDEWEQVFKRKDKLPAVFKCENGEISLWLDPPMLDKMSLEQLMEALTAFTKF